ncbi:hypothetical protein KM043_008408 [Ampulex compressa]|nr:hypothetical protein KM043_008408 [Ampulex compressa]
MPAGNASLSLFFRRALRDNYYSNFGKEASPWGNRDRTLKSVANLHDVPLPPILEKIVLATFRDSETPAGGGGRPQTGAGEAGKDVPPVRGLKLRD